MESVKTLRGRKVSREGLGGKSSDHVESSKQLKHLQGVTSGPTRASDSSQCGREKAALKRRASHPSILSSVLWLASTAQVWLRQSQGCPLTLAGTEPDKPSHHPSTPRKTVLHCSSQHSPPPIPSLSHPLFSSPPLGSALPWAPVPNLQGDYDKNERPPRDGASRDKRERERRGWQRERTRRRRKGLEMDDVTGNFGSAS
ncbi:unnamed protein product [Pleuronectes platessa]|uniref:Uncharacterized protein n=1 Tax=Pleuronectes platessa TaxID=8262 RepID=A0A9N7VPH5_PLEPL|nr:unnamed protein product [Pleuronectes platessa]